MPMLSGLPVKMTRAANVLAVRAAALLGRGVEESPRDAHAALTAAATASVRAAAQKASLDPMRPRYHLAPEAQWVNDPNGPLMKDGVLHVFYQLNPGAETWGTIHWGHARSRDLVHWEHLPVALAPEPKLGEEHCFSGCTVDLGDRVVALYTSIGPERTPRDSAVQCIAVSRDPNLSIWEKQAQKPIIGAEAPGGEKIYDLRDPFVFAHQGEKYMVLGGTLVPDSGGRSVVPLYRAQDHGLTEWEYLGHLYEHPDSKAVPLLECPNFFPIGDAWVLSFSPDGQTRYIMGDFDTETHRFHGKREEVLDLSGRDHFYAPTSTTDASGRRLMFGWVGGFDKRPWFKGDEGRGWNGCLTLPRVLSARPDGLLGIAPAEEVKGLRKDSLVSACGLELEGARVLEGVSGQCLEVEARIDLGDAESAGLVLARSDDGDRGVRVAFDRGGIIIDGTRSAFALLPGEKHLDVRLFLDRSLIELYLNGRAALTRVVDVEASNLGVEIFAAGGKARFEALDVFPLDENAVFPRS